MARAARLVRQNGRELQARLLEEGSVGGPDAVRAAAQEVAEAADDLEHIAALIGEVDTVRRMGHQPGELNHYFYQPRGLVLALGLVSASAHQRLHDGGRGPGGGEPGRAEAGEPRPGEQRLSRAAVGAGGLPRRRRRLSAGLGR